MGWIIDFVFNVVYPFTEKNSLGISIIVLTLIIRFIMLPLAFKSQKSMMAMQRLNPEMDKIKKKYGDTKDPELTKKMNVELQALYAKHKINPLSGCLPLIIQMPIFVALINVFNQSFMYISKLKSVYASLAETITKVPHWTGAFMQFLGAHVTTDMKPPKGSFDIAPIVDAVTGAADYTNFIKYLNKITPSEWTMLFNGNPANPDASSINALASPELLNQIQALYTQKNNIEVFLGLNTLENAGFLWPGIIIPVLTVLTSVLSSWLSMKQQAQTSKDQSAVMQQRIMMVIMPLMMGFFTVNAPIGTGIYWITSSVFQVLQQWIMNKRMKTDLTTPKEAK
jgi:YidC/Oxa1 family membrane protein insertase